MVYLLSLLLSLLVFNETNPEELGRVDWLRNYDKALDRSEKEGKPVFILFQEVPGCSTCKNYGNKVLSHPFIAEAIEDEFIPLVIYNNKGGADRKVLEKYNEPTWNNPVVRIVDSKGRNIVSRLYGNYSQIGVTETMIDALLASNRIIPNYLHLFQEELNAKQGPLKESFVSMYCFWIGEKTIGDIQGVTETEAGFMDGKEVVRFKYNPAIISYEDVIKKARKSKCADSAYSDDSKEQKIATKITGQISKATKKYRSDKDVKYYISQSKYRYLPMTNYQSQKINIALSKGQIIEDFLSPRQQKALKSILQGKAAHSELAYKENFTKAWWDLESELNS